MSDEETLELIHRFNQIPATKDLSGLGDLVTPDFVVHSGDGQEVRGPDGWREFIRSVQEESGDMQAGTDKVLVNGNLVGEQWWVRSSSGTRRGFTMHRIEDGRLAEDWVVFEDIPADGAGS